MIGDNMSSILENKVIFADVAIISNTHVSNVEVPQAVSLEITAEADCYITINEGYPILSNKVNSYTYNDVKNDSKHEKDVGLLSGYIPSLGGIFGAVLYVYDDKA